MTKFHIESLAVDRIGKRLGRGTQRQMIEDLQVGFGDVHESVPGVKALFDKGIVIARQIQTVEDLFEGRHVRAECPKGMRTLQRDDALQVWT